METSQLISVIVPVYNVEDYVERCIRSIMDQTYPLLEIIIVDDGSTDDSGKVCDRLGAEDPRIKVIHQRNGGLVRARKNGLETAAGELIGFVDGDDYIEPVMYERLYQQFIEYKADLVHSGFFYNDGQKIQEVKKEGSICITDENRVDVIKDAIFDRCSPNYMTPSIWSKLFKKDLLTKSYGTIEDFSSFGEDLLCLCNYCMICGRIYVTKEVYYHYTIREKSMSHDENTAMMGKMGCLHHSLHEMSIRYGIWDSLKQCVDDYYLIELMSVLAARERGSMQRMIQVYRFPHIERLFGKKIILYGAGSVGCDYYTQIRKYRQCELAAWTDSHYADYQCEYCEIAAPQIIPDLAYDMVLIAVLNRKSVKEIKRLLSQIGVPEEKIYWECPERTKL